MSNYNARPGRISSGSNSTSTNMVPAPKTPLKYAATVVGAGPAGICAVGCLLDARIRPILWIDPFFDGGRLATYPNVPSNTKVKLFRRYAVACQSFEGVDSALSKELHKLQGESGCLLSCPLDMLRKLTAQMAIAHADVLTLRKTAIAGLERAHGVWLLSSDENLPHTLHAESETVILTTGSHPKVPAHDSVVAAQHVKHMAMIPLDVALEPSELQSMVSAEERVAVVGSSHSAILALKNLVELPLCSRPKEVVNFYRSPLKYAEYLEHDKILHDNTGLKGVAADWARANLTESEMCMEPHMIRRIRTDGNTESQIYASELGACAKIIYAIGFERNSLPTITVDGTKIRRVDYDQFGRLLGVGHQDGAEMLLPGLYGYGIAFPERVTDLDGSPEEAVGLWKFMQFMRRVVPQNISEYLKHVQ